MHRTLLSATLLLLALSGCGLQEPRRGEPIAPGVGRAIFEVRVRHTDLRQVTVLFPADEAGVPTRSALPSMVLLQGGLVGAARYEWLAIRLAQAGYLVALPDHPLELAIFEIDDGRFARDLLVSPPPGSLLEGLADPRRIAVGGHSLGGVVATKLALEGGFAALALLASLPDGADRAALEGMTLPSLSLDQAQERISLALLAFLQPALQGEGTGAQALSRIEGAQVEER